MKYLEKSEKVIVLSLLVNGCEIIGNTTMCIGGLAEALMNAQFSQLEEKKQMTTD